MLRITAGAAIVALALTVSALASARPSGRCRPARSPRSRRRRARSSRGASVARGQVLATGARREPDVLVEVSEANVGSSVVIVYRAVGAGSVSVRYGLTRGETRKAYASATFNVHVK